MSIVTLILSLATCLLVAFGVSGCRMIKIEDDFYFGPLMHVGGDNNDYSNCVKWSKAERDRAFDASMKTAMAFVILALLASVPAFMVLLAMSCCTATNGMRTALVCAFGFCALFQALAFVAFASDIFQGLDIDLKFASGSGVAIAGIVMAIVSAVVATKIPTVDELGSNAPQAGTHVTPAEDEEAAEPKTDVEE